MNHMKNILLSLALCASAVHCVPSCAGPHQVSDNFSALLKPALFAWPAVEVDVLRGIDWMVEQKDLSHAEGTAEHAMVDALGVALLAEDRNAIAAAPWFDMEGYAHTGIEDKLNAGEIGPGVAASLREQIDNFTIIMDKLQGRDQ